MEEASKPPVKAKAHFLNAFNSANIGKYFGNPTLMSILYFVALICFIVILLTTTYVTISSMITIFFVYLFLKQLYYIFNDTKGSVGLRSLIVPFALIIISVLCNTVLPINTKYVIANQSKVVNEIQTPVNVILYASLVYGILFIFALIYHTFDKNKITLLCISFLFIIIFILYSITSSKLPPTVTETQSSSKIIQTLIYTPLVVSCTYIVSVFVRYVFGNKYIFDNYNKVIQNTSFVNNLTRITPSPPHTVMTSMEKKLNELNQYSSSAAATKKTELWNNADIYQTPKDFSIGILITIYAFICIGYFITFMNTAATTSYNTLNELVVIIINGFILAVVLALSMKMTFAGLSVFKSESSKQKTELLKSSSMKNGKYINNLALENEEYTTLTLLIIYNIALSNIFNHNYFSVENEYFIKFLSYIASTKTITKYKKSIPTLCIIVAYIVTFAIYYKVLIQERNVTNARDLTMFFITMILFISVILYINNSPIAQDSSFNDSISPYIYAIIAFAVMFGLGLFAIYVSTKMNIKFFNIEKDELTQSITYALFILFGIFFLFTLINWVIQLFNAFTLKNTDGSSSVLGIMLNLAIIITLMAIIFRMISHSNYFKGVNIFPDSPLSQLIIGSVFYIPCLLIGSIDMITGYYKNGATIMANVSAASASASSTSSLQITPSKTDIILLILIIILYIIYYSIPYLYTKFSSQGGQLLLKEPVYTDNEKVLASYKSLNPPINPTTHSVSIFNYIFSLSDPSFNTIQAITHHYNYALSCWIFIDGNSTANNKSDSFYSLINYGGKPNIQYRGHDNQMIITIDNTKTSSTTTTDASGNPTLYEGKKYDLDDAGNIIIYRNKNVLLQKWNNIVVNYSSGILDIFINGKLQQSFKGHIPYMIMDNITIGEKNGLHGGICNVVYFSKALNIKQVYYLYTSVKELNPPIMLNYYDSLYLSSLKVDNAVELFGLTKKSN